MHVEKEALAALWVGVNLRHGDLYPPSDGHVHHFGDGQLAIVFGKSLDVMLHT